MDEKCYCGYCEKCLGVPSVPMTKGPWTVENYTVKGPNGETVAQVNGHIGGFRCLGNAKILGAAPELLQSLKAVTDQLREVIHSEFQTSRNHRPELQNKSYVRAAELLRKLGV